MQLGEAGAWGYPSQGQSWAPSSQCPVMAGAGPGPLQAMGKHTSLPPRWPCLRRWRHEAQLHVLQASRKARLLAETWQYWAQGAEQLARVLVSGRSPPALLSSHFHPSP